MQKNKMWYANKRTYVFDIKQHHMKIILLISKQNKQNINHKTNIIQQKKKDQHTKKSKNTNTNKLET
jgi:hypothetical protein